MIGVDGEAMGEPRTQRALRVLREAMYACAHRESVDDLIRSVCDILVDVGGFAKAWAGLGSEGALGPEVEWGNERDPIVRAFVTHRLQVELIGTSTVKRLVDAGRAGARAVAVVPLVDDGRVFGVFEVHARDAFIADESAMLDELATNLSFAIAARRIRADLRESERHLHTLLDNIPDHVVRFDARGNLRYSNPASERAFRVKANELVGRPLRALPGIDPTTVRQLESSIQQVMRQRRPDAVDVYFDTAAGRRMYEVRHFPELDDQGRVVGVIGLARDITERKRTEQALIESERAYRSLAEHTPDYIVRWDRELRRKYANPAFARTLGQLPEEVVGSRLGEGYRPQDRDVLAPRAERLAACVRRVLQTELPTSMEIQWIERGQPITQDLRIIPEADAHGAITSVLGIGRDITAIKRTERELRSLADNAPDLIVRLDPEGRYVFVNKALERTTGIAASQWIGRVAGEVMGVDDHGRRIPAFAPLVELARTMIRELRPVGIEIALPIRGRPRMFDVRLIPELDDNGALTSILAFGRDITDRRALEEKLRDAQKMEAIGQLAGGMAHDFNNLLVVILMQAGLASQPDASPEVMRSALELITETTAQAAHLTNQLLTFSRRQVAHPVELDLREIVATSAKLLRGVVGDRVAIEVYIRGDLPRVMADPAMIEQMLINLGLNARDAMPAGGRLVVAVEAVDVSAQQAAAGPGRRAGRHVCLEVTDTGSGIAAADLPRIFEPFFTTKPVGKGTGLGLAAVFGIVQQHQGWLDVESVVHQGTTFRIYLPSIERPAASTERSQCGKPVVMQGGGETILVVEDDRRVRTSLRAMLETLDYRVLEADAPASALQLPDAEIASIALVLTDLVMPGDMTVPQLVEALLAKRPQLKVVYMTGYGAQIASQLLRVPGQVVLQKPFGPTDLSTCIRRALDEPARR